MFIKPSIVLEGTSRAADWIPFATAMLQGMAYDGRATYAPEEGITIIVTRHGSAAKIYINAKDYAGNRFIGIPYDGLYTSGWGAPFDEDNPNGTPGGQQQREVILEKNTDEYEAQRYPQYASKIPEPKYGNQDWTSADGETVLTWVGPNTPHTSMMPYNVDIEGVYCDENVPANNWHKGYYYPGARYFSRGFRSIGFPYDPHVAERVDSVEPLSYERSNAYSNKVYMDGELLVEIKVSAEFLSTGVAETDMTVFGAAIQKVTEEDGSITKYIVVIIATVFVSKDGETTQKHPNDHVYRAPLSDVYNYTLTRAFSYDPGTPLGIGLSTHGQWRFNSTGTEAVAVANHQSGANSDVKRISIDSEGNVLCDTIYEGQNIAPLVTSTGYDTYIDPGDVYAWSTGNGINIIGVDYKNDKLRYAVLYPKAARSEWLIIEDPAAGCDIATITVQYDEDCWFAFMDDPQAMNEQTASAVKVFTYSLTSLDINYGGEDGGSPENPAKIITTEIARDAKYPMFIDCRNDIVVFHNTTEPTNSFSYGFAELVNAFMLEDLDAPKNYAFEMSVNMYIGGSKVYETPIYTQTRSPGDCFRNSIYTLNSQLSCDLTGAQLHLVAGDRGGSRYGSALADEYQRVTSFCNIQTHGNSTDFPEFDILFTMRTKYSDAPGGSFVATWDGETLSSKVNLADLLDINEDGVLANTGKI